mgnify:CR=1 FL=1
MISFFLLLFLIVCTRHKDDNMAFAYTYRFPIFSFHLFYLDNYSKKYHFPIDSCHEYVKI